MVQQFRRQFSKIAKERYTKSKRAKLSAQQTVGRRHRGKIYKTPTLPQYRIDKKANETVQDISSEETVEQREESKRKKIYKLKPKPTVQDGKNT